MIDQIASTVRAVDGDALLDERTMRTIIDAVMQAVEKDREHADRVRAEQRITRGVSHEVEGSA